MVTPTGEPWSDCERRVSLYAPSPLASAPINTDIVSRTGNWLLVETAIEGSGYAHFQSFRGARRRRDRKILDHGPVRCAVFFVVVLLICWGSRGAAAALPGSIPCDGDDAPTTCMTMVGPGSECIDGLCSNPFASGCLRALLGQEIEKPSENGNSFIVQDSTRTLRVCNSQDTEETIANELCIQNPFGYMEIRILTGNWESSLLMAWAMQIVLSEWMQVPTSIESSSPDLQANFYHPTNRFQYGSIAYDYKALEEAYEVGDCTQQIKSGKEKEESDEYRACAHIMPEVWNGQADQLWNLTQRGIIEAPEGNGVVGKLTWFVPKYVAEQRPDLAHYSGWVKNRTDVASLFLRPVTWKEYCAISESGCANPDEYATRPPSETEEGMFFDTAGNGEGFRGYFYDGDSYRDCTANPDNCTGDFIDFPCDWSSFAVPQIHHLGIGLQSRGQHGVNKAYTYGEKLQIWEAANATGNFVVMNWYAPDPTYQWYRGTEAEMQEVQLPPPSPKCVGQRVTTEERCSDDPSVRVGAPEGACGAEVQTLEKVVVRNLYHTIYNLQKTSSHGYIKAQPGSEGNYNQDEADALRSPAYEAVKKFHLSEFDIAKMYEDWRDRLRSRGHNGFSTWDGTTGADPRHVVCQWVADNSERLRTVVPFTYPRVFQEDVPYSNTAISWVALAFGVFVSTCILFMGTLTYVFRKKEPFATAQLPFLYMVLLGLLGISAGGIVHAMAPESKTCVARIWLVTMGYTLELSPLIVKVGAISTMLQAAKRMRRVTIARQTLFRVVGGICILAASYLTAWTIIDAPTKGRQVTLQLDADLEDGTSASHAWWQIPPTPIAVSHYCRSSGSAAWFTVGLVWQCLLLLSAAVLAIQTRRIQRRWNESRSLALMIYAQGGFLVLRFLMWLLEPSGISVDLDIFRSFIFSLDALLALLIYFGSKLVNIYRGPTGNRGRSSTALEADNNRRFGSVEFSNSGGDVDTPAPFGIDQERERRRDIASLLASVSFKAISKPGASEGSETEPLCRRCRGSIDAAIVKVGDGDADEPSSAKTAD